jgi:transposase InsO family protein
VAAHPRPVDRVLARHGTHRPSYAPTPGPRYEQAAANELWHIDLKGPFFFVGATGVARTCHFVALVDDHSRFLLGIRAVPTKEASWILALLEEVIELCGVRHELMTDNGTPFVAITRTMLSRFQRSLAELAIRHIRTQIDTPWTNGKIEAFWATLQAEVLDRQELADLAAAEAAVTAHAGYYNSHRLHVELDWQTPAERFDGTPFTDRGFGSVPSLAGVADLLEAILAGPTVLEVTEHEIIDDYGAVRDAIRSLGPDIRLAVDDAGAGVANFGHIIDLRPDFVKLDISLVRRVDADLGRQAMVVGMRYFSRSAGCRLIAEGVETAEEALTLTSLGVEFGQGYFFGHPESVERWAPVDRSPPSSDSRS